MMMNVDGALSTTTIEIIIRLKIDSIFAQKIYFQFIPLIPNVLRLIFNMQMTVKKKKIDQNVFDLTDIATAKHYNFDFSATTTQSISIGTILAV